MGGQSQGAGGWKRDAGADWVGFGAGQGWILRTCWAEERLDGTSEEHGSAGWAGIGQLREKVVPWPGRTWMES